MEFSMTIKLFKMKLQSLSSFPHTTLFSGMEVTSNNMLVKIQNYISITHESSGLRPDGFPNDIKRYWHSKSLGQTSRYQCPVINISPTVEKLEFKS